MNLTEPDIKGPAGRAWRYRISDKEKKSKPHSLDAYVIYQPGVHAVWSWWFITGCDLHDDDSAEWGRLPAEKDDPDNTHEFTCFALNPGTGFFDGKTPPVGWDSLEGDHPARVGRNILTPPEFVHQDQLRDNDQANEVMRLFVRAVCDGITVADADFRALNIKLLSTTCEHFRRGLHDVH